MIAGAVTAGKTLPRAQRRMIGTLWLAVAIANIAQPFPDLAPLQHGPTVLMLLAAPMLLRRWPLTSASVLCLWLFLLLHTLAARWIYTYVPYDDWARAISGQALSALIGGTRNGFDRLVHFAFGALVMMPVAEIVRRHGAVPRGWAIAFAFCAIGLGSALYEIVEWALTLVAAGETATYYNGQQGDIWDAQKDMALAQTGSALAAILLLRRRG